MEQGSAEMERRPYRRRPQEEWAAIRELYRAGATAKALAARFGGTERAVYAHVSEHGCLRRDQPKGAGRGRACGCCERLWRFGGV